MFNNELVFVGVIILVIITNNGAYSQVTGSISTRQETSVVEDLRELVKSELPEAYMTEDYWLTNWLKINGFNVDNTAHAIRQYLKIRRDENVANMVQEDWSEMRSLFPYSRNTTDKSGKPILFFDLGQWDIVNFLSVEKSSDHLTRYVLMILEESEGHVRQLRAEGQNITQYSALCNAGEFSPAKHVCIHCAYFYHNTSELLTPYIAANSEKVVFVKVPYLFKLVYFFLSEDSKKLIHFYGQDQNRVKKVLEAYIEDDQIPKGIIQDIDENNSNTGMSGSTENQDSVNNSDTMENPGNTESSDNINISEDKSNSQSDKSENDNNEDKNSAPRNFTDASTILLITAAWVYHIFI